ncbi:MAG: hypothetical protein J5953_04225 [Prevotella sp.]|nr:hypothetical protein [Prevotella sp.]
MSEALARAEEMNRNYQSMDTLKGMEQVADYYRPFLGRSQRYMRALYMLGCVYRDRGDAPMALHYYQEAVSQADTTDADCDFHTLCRVYGQMAVLFQEQRSPQLELEAERKAYAAAMKAKDTLAAISYYEHTAGPYYFWGMKDSALAIIEHAADLYLRYNRKGNAAAAMGVAADFYVKKGDFKRAKTLMEQYEANSGFFDINGEITPGRESYYYTKGLYYEGIDMVDSALYYYRKILNHTSDIEELEAGYKGLTSIYHKLRVVDSVFKYSELYTQANDSANILHSADEITRTQALYNYNESQRIAAEKSAEANHYKFLLLFSGAVFILFAHLINRYIKKQKRQKSEEMAAINAKYADTLEQYETAQREFDALKQSSEQFLAKKQQDIEQLQEALALYQADKVNPADWGLERSLLEGDIVKELRRLAAHVQTPTDQQWQSLHATVSKHLPDFYSEITKPQHHLTEKEINVCILIKLRFIPTEIATLLDLTKQRVSNMRRSINHKLFREEVAKTLDSNIRGLKA